MKKTAVIISLAAVLSGGFLILYKNRSAEQKAPPTSEQAERRTNAKQNLEPKTDDQALITVTVTPVDVSAQSKEWKFNIVMDTHSVELDQDMTKTAVLVDGQGKEYKPMRWEGMPAGGHHREGSLVFEQIKSDQKSIELKISGIGDVARNFYWQLK